MRWFRISAVSLSVCLEGTRVFSTGYRHPRESGGPGGGADVCSLDSRFRGNDGNTQCFDFACKAFRRVLIVLKGAPVTRKGLQMRFTRTLSCALLAAAALGSGAASAANICQADKLTCATTMPVGGYCQCTAHGSTQDGTVVSAPAPGQPVNSTAGGCGAEPKAPGCK